MRTWVYKTVHRSENPDAPAGRDGGTQTPEWGHGDLRVQGRRAAASSEGSGSGSGRIPR